MKKKKGSQPAVADLPRNEVAEPFQRSEVLETHCQIQLSPCEANLL